MSLSGDLARAWGLGEEGLHLLRAESTLCGVPVIPASPSGVSLPLSEGDQPCDNTPLSPGRAFSPHREVGPVALRKLHTAMSLLWAGLCGHQLPPD